MIIYDYYDHFYVPLTGMVAMTKEKAKKLEASLDQNSISFPFPSRQGLDWRSRTVARRIEREKRGSHATLSKGIKGQEQAAATSGCVCVCVCIKAPAFFLPSFFGPLFHPLLALYQ